MGNENGNIQKVIIVEKLMKQVSAIQIQKDVNGMVMQ
jgi:hypothetical protein